MILCSCDKSSDDEGRRLGAGSIATDVEPVRKATIKAEAIAEEPAGSASQSLLRLWSHIQSQEWGQVPRFYDPTLLQYLGQKRTVDALKTQGELYRSTQPTTVQVCRVDRRRVVVLYRIREDGQDALRGMTWSRESGDWVVAYDPLLDRALKEEAEKRVQLQVDPHDQVLSQQAVQAGAQAAGLQFRYLKLLKDPGLLVTTRPAEEQLTSCHDGN
jgi:hypothetical protein